MLISSQDSLYGLVESLLAVSSQWSMRNPGAQEEVDLLLERGGAGEETSHQPQQLPPSLFTVSVPVVCQLLDDLAVHLIT